MNTSTPDLTHANWLLFSQEKLIQNVNTNISTEIISSKNKNFLVVSNVSEADIDKLYFLVNTDQNNNYLYLESFAVFYQGASKSVNIPGLQTIMINNFRQSDIKGFISKANVHYPFNVKNFVGSDFTGNTLSEFIDQFTGLIPYSPSTYGNVKTYSFVLNPDGEDTDYGFDPSHPYDGYTPESIDRFTRHK